MRERRVVLPRGLTGPPATRAGRARAALSLSTERLLVRLGAEADAAAIADFQVRNRAHFRRWDPRRAEAFFTEAFWRQRVLLDRRQAEADRGYRVYLFEHVQPRRVIGFASLSNVVRGAFHSCHLGFALDGGRVGQGLMSEALIALIAHAFGPLSLHRVEANHRPDNLRSAATLERLGFIPVGYARDYLRIDGEWRDHVLTARVNPAWRG